MKKLICMTLLSATLFAETNVLVFAGSTREDSYNKKLAREAADLAGKKGAKVTVIDLKDYPMPFYDADLEISDGMPENAKRLRDLMIESDVILIASPEYNASIPAILKNSLDWVSRSEDGTSSRAAFKGKKFGIMSASPGKGGGARGLAHLRAVIEDVGGEVIQKEVSVPRAYEAFNEKGTLEDSTLSQALKEEIGQLFQAKKI